MMKFKSVANKVTDERDEAVLNNKGCCWMFLQHQNPGRQEEEEKAGARSPEQTQRAAFEGLDDFNAEQKSLRERVDKLNASIDGINQRSHTVNDHK